jgi:hypothetical protein
VADSDLYASYKTASWHAYIRMLPMTVQINPSYPNFVDPGKTSGDHRG